MKLENAVILVTGANRGIGLSLVRALLQHKAKRIYAAARDATGLSSLVAQSSGRVVPLQLDITEPEQVAAKAAAAARAKDVTVLINNAGLLGSGSLLSSPLAAIKRDLDTNFMGTLGMTRAFAPALVANGQGAVVNLLTVVSLASMPGLGGYSASKAASWSMTQALRAELGKKGVQVFGVFPGPIDTEMSKDITLPKTSPDVTAENIVAALQADTLDVYPDPMSKQVGAAFEKSPSEVAQMFAAM